MCLEVYGAAVPAESDPVLFASAEFRPVLGRRRIPTHDILFQPFECFGSPQVHSATPEHPIADGTSRRA